MDAPPPHTLSAHQKHQVHITTAQTTQRDGLVLAHKCRITLAVVLSGKRLVIGKLQNLNCLNKKRN